MQGEVQGMVTETDALVLANEEGTPPAQHHTPARSDGSFPMIKTRSVLVKPTSDGAVAKPSTVPEARTLYVRGVELADDTKVMMKRVKEALEAVVGHGGVEKVTVRRKHWGSPKESKEDEDGQRSSRASWALATFDRATTAQEALRACEDGRLGGEGSVFSSMVFQDAGRIQSAEAQAVRLFHA